jgi:transcriptional regulator with XRE-family HTH domain
MSNSEEIRDFLASRRARVTPEQAGLPDYGGKRRVPGLRREEAALLAGISVEYYTRLERGNARGVSESVLEGIARALQLDEAERAHLIDLVRIANTTRRVRRPTRQRVRPSVQRILDSMTGTPALVQNGRLDILHANQLGSALFSEIFRHPDRPANAARFVFLDPRATEFYVEWERIAHDVVALLRAEAGRDPYDRALSDLIGELSTRSEEFRVRWAAHDVQFHRTGVKRFHHPLVGDLTLSYEALALPADPGLTIFAYTAEPNSPSQRGQPPRQLDLDARPGVRGPGRGGSLSWRDVAAPERAHPVPWGRNRGACFSTLHRDDSFLQRIPTISLTCSGGGEEVRGAEPHHE